MRFCDRDVLVEERRRAVRQGGGRDKGRGEGGVALMVIKQPICKYQYEHSIFPVIITKNMLMQ